MWCSWFELYHEDDHDDHDDHDDDDYHVDDDDDHDVDDGYNGDDSEMNDMMTVMIELFMKCNALLVSIWSRFHAIVIFIMKNYIVFIEQMGEIFIIMSPYRGFRKWHETLYHSGL